MKSKDLFIKEKLIIGINNPELRISGINLLNKDLFEVYINDSKIAHKYVKLSQKGNFVLIYKLKKNDHHIKVYFNKHLIYKNHNLFISRIIMKFILVFKKLFKIVFKVFRTLYHGIKYLWIQHHFLVPPIFWGKYFRMFINKFKILFKKNYYNPFIQKDYERWINENKEEISYKSFKYNPLISILIPVYNIDRNYLSECLDSILNQRYSNFEVCIVDDCSTNPETIQTLKEYEKKDSRIKVIRRTKNGHIARATNTALSIASGEFVALMDDDDIITEDALYQMVSVLNTDKTIDFIYSDEDKLDMDGKFCEPHFKPDFSPDSLLGGNYICHFEIFRKSLMEKIGGERPEFVGAQDFDLFLRITELTNKIYHIPKVLYHWRKVAGSTADTIENKEYAILAGQKAVEEALKRRKLNAIVTTPLPTTQYLVEYKYIKEPKVSIIIPTKDEYKALKKCIDSIYDKTDYKNFEIIVINNNSKQKETVNLFKQYESSKENFKVINANIPFNFSKINNIAVKKAVGDYLLFLNNDTEVITGNWISSMVGYAMQKHIGAVGVKLLYPDNTIQHGGVVIGLGDFAQHTFLHAPIESSGFYGRLLVPCDYSAVTAACMMISKDKFNQVNGFNENLEVAFNDVDLCLKLLKKGYYNVFLPQVELYHYESKTRGLDTTTQKYKKLIEELSYMKKNWNKEFQNDIFYNKNFSRKYDFMLGKK